MITSKILLVDDDQVVNYFHSRLITSINPNQEVIVVKNGEEAIKLLKEQGCPGTILLDINMPKMNGWEFIEEYSKIQSEYNLDCNITMVTSTTNIEDEQRAKEFSSISRFTRKPLDIDTMKEILS